MTGNTARGLLILDWQGTLWRPRAHRPADGAAAVLAQVAPRWRIVVASNGLAADITWQLQATGLKGFCSSVYTPSALGAAKPATAFYRALLEREDTLPRRAVMLGDDYRCDVAGAKALGISALWMNPCRRTPPLPHPIHDDEITALDSLPGVLTRKPWPDLSTCMGILLHASLPIRAIRHALAVATAAYRLALLQRGRGLLVDPLLAHRGGLLHDLDKVLTAARPTEHGREGGSTLRTQGHEALARIAERHVFDATCGAQLADWTWEERDVFYADKIVREDELVGLGARMADLAHRYPSFAGTLRRWRPALEELESQITSSVGLDTSELLCELGKTRP